jgi:hypothetical protein
MLIIKLAVHVLRLGHLVPGVAKWVPGRRFDRDDQGPSSVDETAPVCCRPETLKQLFRGDARSPSVIAVGPVIPRPHGRTAEAASRRRLQCHSPRPSPPCEGNNIVL